MAEINWGDFGKKKEDASWESFGSGAQTQDDTEVKKWLKETYTGPRKVENIEITPQIRERYERQKGDEPKKTTPSPREMAEQMTPLGQLELGAQNVLQGGTQAALRLTDLLARGYSQSPTFPGAIPHMQAEMRNKQPEISRELGYGIAGSEILEKEKGLPEGVPQKILHQIGAMVVDIPAKYSNPAGLGIMAGEGFMETGDTAQDYANQIKAGGGSGEIKSDKTLLDILASGGKSTLNAAALAGIGKLSKLLPKGVARPALEGGAFGGLSLAEGGTLEDALAGGMIGGYFGYKKRNEPQIRPKTKGGRATVPSEIPPSKDTGLVEKSPPGASSQEISVEKPVEGPVEQKSALPTEKQVGNKKVHETKIVEEQPTVNAGDPLLGDGLVTETKKVNDVSVRELSANGKTVIKSISNTSGQKGMGADWMVGEIKNEHAKGNTVLSDSFATSKQAYDMYAKIKESNPEFDIRVVGKNEAGGDRLEIFRAGDPRANDFAKWEPTASKPTQATPTVSEQGPETSTPEGPRTKISQVVTNQANVDLGKQTGIGTFTKEFGGKTAMELSRDFAEYPVREPERAANELLRDGIQKTTENLINKKGAWDEYDALKANKIREQVFANAQSPEELDNPQFKALLKRTKEELSAAGKLLETAREVNPIEEPIRAAERKLNEQIEGTPKLRKLKAKVEGTTKRITEVLGKIDKEVSLPNRNKAKLNALMRMLGKEKVKTPGKDVIQRIIELSNSGAMDKAELSELVGRRLGIPVLTPEHMFQISKQAQKIQQMPDTTPAERDAIIDDTAKLYSMLYTDAPKTVGQKLMDARIIGMLFNVKSAQRNIGGQGADAALTTIGKFALGRLMDRYITRAITKRLGVPQERTLGPTEWKALIKGFGGGMKRGWKDVKKWQDSTKAYIEKTYGVKLGPAADKFGMGKPEWKEGGLGQRFQRGVGYLLQAPDTAFQIGIFEESFKNQVNALRPETRANMTQEMRQRIAEQAFSEASQITYRRMNKFSESIVALQQRLGVVGKFLLTFPKVASNILYTGAYKYGPVGAGVAMHRINKFIKSGGVEIAPKKASDPAVNQRQLVFDFARGGTGTAIVAAGILAGFSTESISGGKEDDPRIQKTKEATGERPSSIKIGNHWYSFDWLQPAMIPFELGVTIGKALRDKNAGEFAENAINTLTRGASSIIDQPLFTTLSRVTSAPGENAGQKALAGIETLVTSSAASMIPTLSGQARQLADKYQRNITAKFGRGQVNQLKAFGYATGALIINKLPFASKLLEKKKDIFGRDVTYHQSGNFLLDVLDRFANPIIISDAKKEPGLQFILKLNEDLPEDFNEKPLPRQTDRTWYLTQDGKRYYFTPQQKAKYGELIGKEVYEFVNDYVNEGWGEGVDPEDQAKDIYKEMNKIGKRYREELLEEMVENN